MKAIYEVVCTYEIEADSKAGADRVAAAIANSLSRTGVIRSSSVDGNAYLKGTHKRFGRFITGRTQAAAEAVESTREQKP